MILPYILERGVRTSCFDDLDTVRRSFAPANAPNPRTDDSFRHNINVRRITRFSFPSRSPTHAQPTLRHPPFRPVHIRLELKDISNRPRCAPVHDQGIHDRLVGDVQQIHRAYPELHSGNIHCGRLYGATKYAVQRHP